jgi:hypothetical protein
MNPYNTPERIGTDQGGSVDKPIPYMQRGHMSGKINSTDLFIPCDLDTVDNVAITPIANATGTSDNQVALFTTVAGWEFDALDNANLKAVSDIDDWVTGTVYEVGTVVDGIEDDSIAYICVFAHTADTLFADDLALVYWQALSTTKFIQMSHTSGGSGDVADFNYILFGKMNR